MHRRITFWLALAGLFLAVRLVMRLSNQAAPPPPGAEPARAPYEDSIGARGLVESVDENVRIAPALAGLVTKVLVHVGDDVVEGQALIEQDTREATAQMIAEEARLATQRAQIEETQVALADKKDAWERQQQLAINKVASDDERERARYAYQTAEARVATMQAEFDATKAALELRKTQLELLTIRAPRAGRILQVNTRAGEFASVSANEPLILLGKVDDLQLRAEVDEDSASRVRPGTRAVAYLKGRLDEPIDLRFVRIEPYVVPKKSLTGESSERVDTRVLQIIFRFDRPERPVYVGQQMDVFIDAGESKLP